MENDISHKKFFSVPASSTTNFKCGIKIAELKNRREVGNEASKIVPTDEAMLFAKSLAQDVLTKTFA